jgi:hypothetical protein
MNICCAPVPQSGAPRSKASAVFAATPMATGRARGRRYGVATGGGHTAGVPA